MAPISVFYGGLLAIVYLYLSILVIRGRWKYRISIGDDNNQHFMQLRRAHANFAEYVPIGLILLLLAELNAAAPVWLHSVGVLLLAGRVLHAFGLRHHVGPSWQRVAGMLMTFASILLAAVVGLSSLY